VASEDRVRPWRHGPEIVTDVRRVEGTPQLASSNSIGTRGGVLLGRQGAVMFRGSKGARGPLMLRLRTFGSLALQGPLGEDRLGAVSQPKRLALLAYLAAADKGGFHRRDTLVALLWPDLDQERARAALRKALHYLRSSLGPEVVVTRGDEEVRLEPSALWCDAREFAELAARREYGGALDLYAGEFLSGLHVSGAPEFERWVDQERQRYRSTARDCAIALVHVARQMGSPADAVASARRAVDIVPLEELANRQLVERLAELGDVPAAVAAFDRYAARLAEDLELQPSEDFRGLIDRLRRRAPAGRAAPSEARGEPITIPDQSGADARPGSVELRSATAGAVSSGRTRRRTRALMVAAGATMLGLTTFAIVRANASRDRTPAPTRRQITFSGKALRAAISPDGQFIAFTVRADSTALVLVQDLAGGAPDTVASWPGKILTLEWSPDGTRLLLGSVDEALVIPRLGGAQRHIRVPGLAGYFAFWLPDGRISLHSSGAKRILILDLDKEDTLAIPVRGTYWVLTEGAWSPDGRRFALVIEHTNPTRSAIQVLSLDGDLEVTAEDTVPLGSPRWSRDGDTVFYLRDYLREAAVWLVAVSPRTGRPRGVPRRAHAQLEALPVEDGFVHFSATRDARQMVYARGMGFSNLVIVEDHGASGRQRVRTLTTGTTRRWSPVVSPDGRWIGFAAGTYGAAELFRMPIDGGPATQLTFGARVWPDGQIAWSPDGREIAFESVRAGRARVWIASAGDGRLRELNGTRIHLYTGHLTWAPGREIAYLTDERRRVNLVDPTSGVVRALVADTAPGFFFSPRYSPDGRRLAVYWHRRSADEGVWVFDLQTGFNIKIAPNGWPRGWSADGQHVYAGEAFTGSARLARVSARGLTPPTSVFNLPFRSAECATGGKPREHVFVCAIFDFVSDIWMIENFNTVSR
jgi:DNA-binding SARP family transcriptional activator/Tol biopolymer transport system component